MEGVVLSLLLASLAHSQTYIVKVDPTLSAEQVTQTLTARGLRQTGELKRANLVLAESMDEAGLSAFSLTHTANSAGVGFIEKDALWHAIGQPPSDPLYSQQSGLKRLKVPEAWEVTQGSRDIVVAVIDSGVDYNHPDLQANMWVNQGEIPGNGVDDDQNGYVDDVVGYDFHNNDADPMDFNNHGTHVAGIVGAVGDNGLGISGVSQRVRMMALQFLGSGGTGNTMNGVEAVYYAVDNGAHIINASWGGTTRSQALQEAIEYARDRGVLFVAASGNDSVNTDQFPNYPSAFPTSNIIAVASSVSDGVLSSFSNSGARTVDLAAPGSSILSTLPQNRYGRISGTSMATPMVAGVAALVLDSEPTLSMLQLRNTLLGSIQVRSGYSGLLSTRGDLDAELALNPTPAVQPNTLTLNRGDNYTFTVRAAQAVAWSSSNPDVLGVNASGEVEAKSEGTATLSAVLEGGGSLSSGEIRVVNVGGGGPPGEGGGGCALAKQGSSADPMGLGLPVMMSWIGWWVGRGRRRKKRPLPTEKTS